MCVCIFMCKCMCMCEPPSHWGNKPLTASSQPLTRAKSCRKAPSWFTEHHQISGVHGWRLPCSTKMRKHHKLHLATELIFWHNPEADGKKHLLRKPGRCQTSALGYKNTSSSGHDTEEMPQRKWDRSSLFWLHEINEMAVPWEKVEANV